MGRGFEPGSALWARAANGIERATMTAMAAAVLTPETQCKLRADPLNRRDLDRATRPR